MSAPASLRVLVNASTVGTSTGGTWAYLEELLRSWTTAFPEDALEVRAHPSFPDDLERELGPSVRVMRAGANRAGLVLAQHALTGRRARRFRADVVFNAALSAPLLGSGGLPQVTMAHDIRHLERPDEFGVLARRYRGLVYDRALRRSAILTCGGAKTANEILARFPRPADSVRVTPLGADHVDRWPRGPKGTHGVAFAHWTNKRPETAIRAWADLNDDGESFARELHIVGTPETDRERLENLAHAVGVGHLVRVRDRLADAEFRRLLGGAAVMLLPSTLEGFGIPVIESMRLGVPVVVSAGVGMEQAGGEAALYADPEQPAAFAAHCRKLWSDPAYEHEIVKAGLAHAAGYSWRATADATRTALRDARKNLTH